MNVNSLFPLSGVPASEADNTLPAVPSVGDPACEQLWYGTKRCTPRFDAAAANAVLAEILSVGIKADRPHDCTRLDNLAEAIYNLIGDYFVGCIPSRDLSRLVNSGNACTIRDLVLVTTPDGCTQIATLDGASNLGTFSNSSVYGLAFPPTLFPVAPNDASTYYEISELQAASNANAVVEVKLAGNILAQAVLDLPCKTDVIFDITNVTQFDPQSNGGLGRSSTVIARNADTKVFIGSNNDIQIMSPFTNFVTSARGEIRATLPAGISRINFYLVAYRTKPAQVTVIGSPTASGIAITVRRAVN